MNYGAGSQQKDAGGEDAAHEIARPVDETARLHVIGLVDPIGRAKQVIEEIARLSPVGMSDPDELFQLGSAASAVWADNLAVPFLRTAAACARAHGRMNLLFQTLAFEAWAEIRRGAVREAITRAAELPQAAG